MRAGRCFWKLVESTWINPLIFIENWTSSLWSIYVHTKSNNEIISWPLRLQQLSPLIKSRQLLLLLWDPSFFHIYLWWKFIGFFFFVKKLGVVPRCQAAFKNIYFFSIFKRKAFSWHCLVIYLYFENGGTDCGTKCF